MRPTLFGTVVALMLASAVDARAREVLDYDALMRGTDPGLVDFHAYAPGADAQAPQNTFEGRLRLTGPVSSHVTYFEAGLVGSHDVGLARSFPQDFDFDFVQDGDALVPLRRGLTPSRHDWWDFIVEPGKVWNEPGDHGFSRAAIPFSLQQKNANCTHNGVLMFLFRADGSASRAALQIVSETCRYLQLDLWGLLKATYDPRPVPGKAQLVAAYRREVSARLPVRSIERLSEDFPAVVAANFAIGPPNGRTLYGLVVNGIDYVSACPTRRGNYPYCDVLDLPSYSIAKSLFAGLALMRLQKNYPGTAGESIAKYVPQCQGTAWAEVTFLNALDMATGNFNSSGFEVDENSLETNGLFLPLDHDSKITYSCSAYPHRAAPATTWVYHTSDTYILGAALNAYLRTLPGRSDQDIFTDVVVAELYAPLQLSPVVLHSRRTTDDARQPFTGWGLTFHRDDIARLAHFVSVERGELDGKALLDPELLDAALQRNPRQRGLEAAAFRGLRYQHGFWTRDVQGLLGCAHSTWVPFLSGFGGISVVLFPNGTIYYNFADDGSIQTFDWSLPALEVAKLGRFCQ